MKSKGNWFIAVFAILGAAACVTAMVQFLLTVSNNELAWNPDVRDHYLIVGQFYTQGFVVGFFLCFSLALVAVSVAGWWERQHSSASREPRVSRFRPRIKRRDTKPVPYPNQAAK